MNCFIYCRVSTEEQADKGYSLDTQEKLCRDFAERNHYRVVAVFRDEGKSGTSLERPALQELISRSTDSNSVDAVIVQETDRLARNTKDHLTVKAVLKKRQIRLISVAQPMLDDSPEGMMIDTILASVNQFQSDINSRKTKRGLQERFNQGWLPGRAPLGYINAEIGDGSKGTRNLRVIREDPNQWSILQEGFRLYLTGDYSADEVNDILYKRGLRARNGKKLAHSVIVHTLKNPFYAGIVKWNGQEKIGRHKPMISKDEHEHLLHIMDAHNMHACRRRKHTFLLRGFVFCNICGRRYTAEKHAAKNKEYYHCASMRAHSNRGQNIEASDIERLIEEQFKTLRFSDEYIKLVMQQMRSVTEEQRKTAKQQKHILDNRRKTIEARRDKAEETYLDGLMPYEDWARLRDKFSLELAQLDNQTGDLDGIRENQIDIVQEVLRLTRDAYGAYKSAPYELKRLYLSLFWEKFLIQDKEVVEAIPTELVRILQARETVIITSDSLPSPLFIITFENREYMKKLRETLEEIAEFNNPTKQTLPPAPKHQLAFLTDEVQSDGRHYPAAA